MSQSQRFIDDDSLPDEPEFEEVRGKPGKPGRKPKLPGKPVRAQEDRAAWVGRVTAERPAWMRDRSLLPRKPPGRS